MSLAKITLISPYLDISSYSIRTLSSCLKNAGHDVHIIFLRHEIQDNIEDIVLNDVVAVAKDSLFIGISLMANNIHHARQVTEHIKNTLNIPVIWGGIHPTLRPEECLQYADAVCLGDGEEVIVEIAEKLESKSNLNDVKSVWFKTKDNVIVKNALIEQNIPLDDIPFNDFDIVNHYILHNGRLRPQTHELQSYYLRSTYCTLTSRGCPYNCKYCCNNAFRKIFSQYKVRMRSIPSIIEELKWAKKEIPYIYSIRLDDENFFCYSLEDIREFASMYKREIGLPLMILGISPGTFNKDKLQMLYDAGLYYVRMGIQSGSERIRKMYGRLHSNEYILSKVNELATLKSSDSTSYDIITDNPWEEYEDTVETIKLLLEFPTPYTLVLFSLTFYPGTDLYEKAKEDGIIRNDFKEVYMKDHCIIRDTELNKLLLLMSYSFSCGNKVIIRIIKALINAILKKKKISPLYYKILFLWSYFCKITRPARRAINYLIKGDFKGLTLHLKRIFFQIIGRLFY